MRTDDLDAAFAIRRASVTDSNAVLVECPFLKPDWWTSNWLFRDRKDDTWLKAACSSVFPMNGIKVCNSLGVMCLALIF